VAGKPPPNVNAQVNINSTPSNGVEEMAIASEDDDDDVRDEQESISPEYESEWLFSLQIVIYLSCSIFSSKFGSMSM
jgi:hypothetical protein